MDPALLHHLSTTAYALPSVSSFSFVALPRFLLCRAVDVNPCWVLKVIGYRVSMSFTLSPLLGLGIASISAWSIAAAQSSFWRADMSCRKPPSSLGSSTNLRSAAPSRISVCSGISLSFAPETNTLGGTAFGGSSKPLVEQDPYCNQDDSEIERCLVG